MNSIITNGIISMLLITSSLFPNYKNENKIDIIERTKTNFNDTDYCSLEDKEINNTYEITKDFFVDFQEFLEEEKNQIEIKKNNQKEEYEVAYYVWNKLKENGFNDYVCAGIIGNMMAEVGGQTLNLEYDLYSNNESFYGLCQWNYDNYSEVHGKNYEYQVNFLLETIENEFDMFEYTFNFSYDDFLNLENEKESAIMFAMIYERCDSSTYWVRQENASVAYNYFVG